MLEVGHRRVEERPAAHPFTLRSRRESHATATGIGLDDATVSVVWFVYRVEQGKLYFGYEAYTIGNYLTSNAICSITLTATSTFPSLD